MENRASERTWVLPDEPVPVRLMSTIWADTDGVHDDFQAPADVDDWLDALGFDRSGATTTTAEFERARLLRDSVRRLAAHVTEDDRPAAASAVESVHRAMAAVNATAAELPAVRLALDDGELHFTADLTVSPVTAHLAAVADEAQHLLGENANVLRACHAPGCVLYFAKTHPRREWCSIACGNRARAARHYEAVRSARNVRKNEGA